MAVGRAKLLRMLPQIGKQMMPLLPSPDVAIRVIVESANQRGIGGCDAIIQGRPALLDGG
jgi:hypothetical protein